MDDSADAGGRAGRLALPFLGLATALAIIDATIVNVALPSISRDLALSLSAGEWVVSGYGVTLASLLISAGRLGDRIGQRRMLLAGVLLFTAASLGCALAQDGTLLVVSRFVQGAGASAILPTVAGIINTQFRGPALSVAFAVYGATIGTAAALGPLIGSLLIDHFGWRSAFLVNLPVAAVIVVGLVLTVPAGTRGPRLRSDPWGQVLLLAGLSLLVFGLVESPRNGWFRPTAAEDLGPWTWGTGAPVSAGFTALVLAVALLAGFVAVELRRSRQDVATLVDLTLFQIPSFRAGSIAVLIVALGEFGVLFLLPLYLQVGQGLSVVGAQLVILPTALGAFISAPITARRRTVPSRTWVLVGLAMEVVGLVLLSLVLTPSAPDWLLAVPLLVYGTGVGFAISQLTSATLLSVPVTRIGQASGVSSTARQIGSAIGVATLTAILAATLSQTLPKQLEQHAGQLSATQRSQVAGAINASPAAASRVIQALPAPVRPAVTEATTLSLSLGTRLAALAAAVPIAGAWLLSRNLPTQLPTQPAPGAPGRAGPGAPAATTRRSGRDGG